MPVRPLLKARFVPPLTVRTDNSIPLTWDGGDHEAKIPGGAYLPHELALAIGQAIADAIGESGAVTCAARTILDDATGAFTGISLLLINQGSADLVVHCASDSFSLKVMESAPLGVGPEYGSQDLAVDAGEEGTLLSWPLTGLWPLTLSKDAFTFENAGRVDAQAETGRRISWAGRGRSALRARLIALPRNGSLAPASWSFGDARWHGEGENAPLCALFGPGSAVMRGASFLVLPDSRGDAMIPLELAGRGALLQRRIHGFVDLSFEAREEAVPAGLKQTGAEYSDDFSGDLSKWSASGSWSINGGELEVNTTGSAALITLNEDLGDCEVEMRVRFLAAPAEGEYVRAGPGVFIGGSGYLGCALRGRKISGEEVTDLVTWTSGTAAPTGVIATLQRALPTDAQGLVFRVQFLSNPKHLAPGALRIRAWVGEEGPFAATLVPGGELPRLRSPCILYQDDLAADPGAEARFDDFVAREILWDFTPNLRTLESLELD